MANSLIIVDDDANIHTQVRAFLKEYPVLIKSARNGQEALELLRAEGPVDLVLLDLAMPVMDGVLFLEAIRSDRRHSNKAEAAFADSVRNLPVIVISATEDRDEILALKRYHVSGFLMKPVKKEPLMQRVEAVINGPLEKSRFPDIDIMLDL
ncbi:MAG: response regulator [Leptospirales bacterium]|jgi:two-component system chemotaxis response regulator CheY